MKNTLWPLNMKTYENNIKQDTPYPLHKERSILNTISIQTVTEISRKRKMRLRKQNSYLFLMIWIRNEAPMKFENGCTECLRKRQLRKKMNSNKSSRENWKRFKNCLYFCQTRVFCDLSESPQSHQFKLPKHSKTKIWKNFLSVLCDWKVYSRESCELSHENLWVTLTTGPSTCEQVTKNDPWARDWGS